MTQIEFGSKEAQGVIEADRILNDPVVQSGFELESVKVEIEDTECEIDMLEEQMSDLQGLLTFLIDKRTTILEKLMELGL